MTSMSSTFTEVGDAGPSPLLWAGIMGLASLTLTGMYELIASSTYDFDEFVYLLLGRGVAAGHLPYRDFLFYHPPGILVVMAAMQPLLNHWWAWGRGISILLSAATCGLVYLTARRFLTHIQAVVAALLLACNPIMLVTGTRIMPDVYVMFFTFLGVFLLLPAGGLDRTAVENLRVRDLMRWVTEAASRLPQIALSLIPTHADLTEQDSRRDWLCAVLSGASFGFGIWFKYPTVLALPAALLLARRRSLVFLLSMAITTVLLFSPFLASHAQLYQDTVVYQQSRFTYPLGIRLTSILLFAVLLQPLAVFGMFTRPVRWWLVAGYASVFLYLASSQVYYHYMLPAAPFASILGAVYLTRLRWPSPRVLAAYVAAGAVATTLIWAAIMTYTPGNYPFHITSAHTANVDLVARYIDHHVPKGQAILDDQPDLPVLAYRPNCADYFWSDASVITHTQLQNCLDRVHYVVHFFGSGSGYPPGFLYPDSDGSGIAPGAVDDKYRRVEVGSATYGAFIYITHSHKPYLPQRN
jgi:hypothetical protein